MIMSSDIFLRNGIILVLLFLYYNIINHFYQQSTIITYQNNIIQMSIFAGRTGAIKFLLLFGALNYGMTYYSKVPNPITKGYRKSVMTIQ
jgi:hypothetical protein